MNIYRIVSRPEEYGILEVDSDEMLAVLDSVLFSTLGHTTHTIENQWDAFSAWFEHQDTGADVAIYPDISVWENCILVMSEDAKKILSSLLEPIGEFLPLTTPNGRYFAYIPHKVISVNLEQSSRRIIGGVEMEPTKIVFQSEEVGTNTIFKSDYNNFTCSYCSDRFKDAVEKHNLKGLFFDKKLEAG